MLLLSQSGFKHSYDANTRHQPPLPTTTTTAPEPGCYELSGLFPRSFGNSFRLPPNKHLTGLNVEGLCEARGRLEAARLGSASNCSKFNIEARLYSQNFVEYVSILDKIIYNINVQLKRSTENGVLPCLHAMFHENLVQCHVGRLYTFKMLHFDVQLNN